MRIWFALGIEPWLLPPLVELGRALTAAGHNALILYVGDAPSSGDALGVDASATPRRLGMRRLLAPADLIRLVLSQGRHTGTPDLLIACDPVALQAATVLRSRFRLGYWGFEIVEAPRSLRLSADAWRARHLGRWLRHCEVLLAPSASRLAHLTRHALPRTRALVIPNCRCDGDHKLEPVAAFDAHPVSRLPRLLVHAGRVSPTQYIHEIVQSLRLLPEDVGLVVAGIGHAEYRRRLHDEVDRLKLADRCLLLDRLSRAQTDGILRAATLGFVLYDSSADPGAADPAPNKVGDYAALGVPMVGTAQPYLHYWLETRGLGACVREPSAETLASTIRDLLRPSDLERARAACTLAASHDLNMRMYANTLIDSLALATAWRA